MNILGNNIVLRAIEEEDLPLLHKWANDPLTQDIIGDIHFPSSIDFHRSWFEGIKNEPFNQRLAIEVSDLGIIGLSSIIKIDWRNKHAWHGILLGDKEIRGKGYGVDAVMATMRYAFEELNLVRLDGSMIEYNERSINFYCEKLGWKKEGIRRNYYYRRGRYWDQIIVGITKSDYEQLIRKNNFWDKNE